MTHPLVDQLRFTRREFRRALEGVRPEDAVRRLMPMNCLSWNVGHLAWHEQRYFLTFAQQSTPRPDLNELFAYGAPGGAPDLAEMWKAWDEVTQAADPWLDAQTAASFSMRMDQAGPMHGCLFGSLLQRVIYHYWYHIGENMGIRQMLGHTGLPEFVGNLDEEAPFRPV